MTRDAYMTLYRCGHTHLTSDHQQRELFCPSCAPGLKVTCNTNLDQQALTEAALPTDLVRGVLDEFPDGIYETDNLDQGPITLDSDCCMDCDTDESVWFHADLNGDYCTDCADGRRQSLQGGAA